jgi:hypothetical protein
MPPEQIPGFEYRVTSGEKSGLDEEATGSRAKVTLEFNLCRLVNRH